MMLEQVQLRLGYLESVGLGYLTLDRTIRTLSGGEARRVALTSALGSSLVNMLYVLDEPSIGLHPRDVDALVESIRKLRDRANTVVVVEHEEAMIRAADHVIEIGPGAGERGGRVVFQGTPAEMEASPDSLTGDYLAGRRGSVGTGPRRQPNHGWIRLAGARGNNLKNVTVEFPLGVLCLVTGVSGSGKSTLVEDTLYPALCRRCARMPRAPLACDDVFGDGQIDDVIMVDQSPIGRSPRSNPVTYLKVFDEIRNVFAETVEARTRNYDAGHFSFNVDGGRCSACQGDGYIRIDMQFLADVFMKCSQCHGTRYRDEILDVTYRGRNIAEVLEMTVREAFTFFRGQPKVQSRLKRLIDVGLDYVRLGQPANTLSGGEAQRLKLAGYMSAAKRGRCLFILDEPTTGLHFSDMVQLLDCFDALLAVGHSLIVVEHNLQMMKAADYIIDLGPGAADQGGQVVAKGTPEMVAWSGASVTARFWRKCWESSRRREELQDDNRALPVLRATRLTRSQRRRRGPSSAVAAGSGLNDPHRTLIRSPGKTKMPLSPAGLNQLRRSLLQEHIGHASAERFGFLRRAGLRGLKLLRAGRIEHAAGENELLALYPPPGGDRRHAAAVQCGEHRPLGLYGGMRRRVIQAGQGLARGRVVGPGLDPQRPLAHRGKHQAQRQDLRNVLRQPQTVEAGLGQDNGLVVPFAQLPQARVDVAANVAHFQIAAMVEQLGPAAEAARPHHGAGRQEFQGAETVGDEHVGHRGPLGHGRQGQARHGFRRQVLQTVDRQVDPPGEQFALDLLGEYARAGRSGPAGRSCCLVATGRDRDQFDFQPPLAKLRRHPIGLPLGQQAGAVPKRS